MEDATAFTADLLLLLNRNSVRKTSSKYRLRDAFWFIYILKAVCLLPYLTSHSIFMHIIQNVFTRENKLPQQTVNIPVTLLSRYTYNAWILSCIQFITLRLLFTTLFKIIDGHNGIDAPLPILLSGTWWFPWSHFSFPWHTSTGPLYSCHCNLGHILCKVDRAYPFSSLFLVYSNPDG